MNTKKIIIGGLGVLGTIAAILIFKKPAQASTKGTLKINSVPAGAIVDIGGTVVGFTPLTLQLNAGGYTIKLSSDGYETATKSATVTTGETTTVDVTLKLLTSGDFICEYDGLKFTTLLDLLEHTSTQHPNCCPYGDAICFTSFDALVNHILNEHPGKRIPTHIFS